ncbi:MAG: sulfatase-like hydrolase/transferase [Pseudomonadota bacterium]
MRQVALLAVSAAAIFAVLVLPNHPGTMKWSALNRWPLELPVLLLGAIAVGRRLAFLHVVALVLVICVFIKVADYVMFSAYNRTFNPILDTFLIEAGFSLLRDSIGGVAAGLVAIGAVLALLVVYIAIFHSLRTWSGLNPPGPMRALVLVAAVGATAWAVADAGHHLKYWSFERSPPGTAWTSRLTAKRALEMRDTAVDLADFSVAARTDPYAKRSDLFDRLGGRDVLIIWIESYGRASFENPVYAPTHLATLRAAEEEIRAAGLGIKSGWLTSPTAGGQSWLAHGALASGLWTDNHGRYNAMLASGRRWLFHFAREAGYRTSAVMPAITVGWPESSAMGFDVVIPAADIPYKGERFRWVTMPDQFTLATYSDLLPPDPRPDFVQIALISSHAPWTPIARMVPWEEVGDGTVFNEMARQGPTPRALWKDRDAVRDAYRRSVDYSLRAAFSHVARLGPDAPLVIVAGDHQAASFVAGSESKDVAVHMIAPEPVLDSIAHWGWNAGLLPDPNGPVRRMDSFRNDFLDAFSTAAQSAMAGG